MIIESLARLENKTDSFEVIFDDGSKVKVSAAQIADFGLYTGLDLSEEEQKELADGISLSSSKTRAIRILGNRSLSAREMEKRLVRKGESEDIAQETVKWLEDIGAINDDDYASTIVRHYCAKGYGIARIRDELYRRGIPREMWDEALNGLEGMDDAAYAFLEKKLRGSRDKDNLRRATDALCRRGYSYEEARTAIKKYTESLEETEEEER